MPTAKEVADWIRCEARSRNQQAFQQGSWMAVADAIEENFRGSEFLGMYENVPVVVRRPEGWTDDEWSRWKKKFTGRLVSVVGEVRQPLTDDILDEYGF